jgi:hypothetical protein
MEQGIGLSQLPVLRNLCNECARRDGYGLSVHHFAVVLCVLFRRSAERVIARTFHDFRVVRHGWIDLGAFPAGQADRAN